MNIWKIYVDNLKCGGCEHTVTQLLLTLSGVEDVHVDATSGEIEVSYSNPTFQEEKALILLKNAGYPRIGESTITDRMKSYVSCVKGKINQ